MIQVLKGTDSVTNPVPFETQIMDIADPENPVLRIYTPNGWLSIEGEQTSSGVFIPKVEE